MNCYDIILNLAVANKQSVMRKICALLLFTSLLLIIPAGMIIAQDNTLYLMPGIPQANQLNPALFQKCRIYVALPVISSVKVNIRNSGFGYHDAIYTGTGAQSDNYYLNMSNLDKKLRLFNYFQTAHDIDLLGFGFGFKDWYFTFGIANHSDLLLSYPHDVLSLEDKNLQVAIDKATPINLNNLGAEITLWNSIGLSVTKEFRDGFKVGLRLKYLQGMANINTHRSELLFNTTNNPNSLEAQMKIRINSSFPVIPGYAANGLVNNLNFDNSFNDISGDFIFNGNHGFAIDAGMVYNLDEITQLTASFTDLGFIRWKKNTNYFTATRNYFFNGNDLAQFQANSGQANLLRALQDSISGAFSSSVSAGTYFTLSPVKIFGGVTRLLRPNLRAGAMVRIEIYNLQVMPSFSFSMNYTPFPSVAASLSYTLMNNKFNQIGAGLAFGNRGVQFYLVTDNIPIRFTKDSHSPLIWPYNARMLSLRLGFNLLFNSCNKKEKKQQPKNYRKSDLCHAYW
jgi:hypothetical protein